MLMGLFYPSDHAVAIEAGLRLGKCPEMGFGFGLSN